MANKKIFSRICFVTIFVFVSFLFENCHLNTNSGPLKDVWAEFDKQTAKEDLNKSISKLEEYNTNKKNDKIPEITGNIKEKQQRVAEALKKIISSNPINIPFEQIHNDYYKIESITITNSGFGNEWDREPWVEFTIKYSVSENIPHYKLLQIEYYNQRGDFLNHSYFKPTKEGIYKDVQKIYSDVRTNWRLFSKVIAL